MSCSIDILISSNLERLLFELADRDPQRVRGWMRELSEHGSYTIDRPQLAVLNDLFAAGWCSEQDTLETSRRTYERHGYLMDPHTAVAQTVYTRYAETTGDGTQTVLLSTANPYKFASDVLSAFETPGSDDFGNADRLHALTGMRVPAGLSELLNKPERHLDVCDLAAMRSRVIAPVR